jgi:hypothetical protein
MFSMITLYVEYNIPTKHMAYLLNRALPNSMRTLMYLIYAKPAWTTTSINSGKRYDVKSQTKICRLSRMWLYGVDPYRAEMNFGLWV